MLIHAFAAEVTQDIELPALKHYVDDLVQKNLGTR
jgi:hypothetical protein